MGVERHAHGIPNPVGFEGSGLPISQTGLGSSAPGLDDPLLLGLLVSALADRIGRGRLAALLNDALDPGASKDTSGAKDTKDTKDTKGTKGSKNVKPTGSETAPGPVTPATSPTAAPAPSPTAVLVPA